jgi:hypothetical protein
VEKIAEKCFYIFLLVLIRHVRKTRTCKIGISSMKYKNIKVIVISEPRSDVCPLLLGTIDLNKGLPFTDL